MPNRLAYAPPTRSHRGNDVYRLRRRLLCVLLRPHLGRLPTAAVHTGPGMACCLVDNDRLPGHAISRLGARRVSAVQTNPGILDARS